MNPTRVMHWTCPRCLTRNSRLIPADTNHGKLLAVRCESCREDRHATAIIRPQPGKEPAVYGVAWV